MSERGALTAVGYSTFHRRKKVVSGPHAIPVGPWCGLPPTPRARQPNVLGV
jgi:hypothetical protein